MKNTIFPFTTLPGVGSKPLTEAQAKAIFTEADITAGQKLGKLKTFGPWQQPLSYTALACSQDFSVSSATEVRHQITVYGVRTLSHARQAGHELEGRVSLNGKSYRAFTSSCLFQLPDGKLVDCAVIHVCLPR
jgi:hypothetical protein